MSMSRQSPHNIAPTAAEAASAGRFTDPMLKVGSNDNEPIAEEYRKLKSIIIQTARKKGLPYTLLVGSTVSNEGKSITALNLALNLAKENDATVLLIDADLRKPSLCKYLNVKAEVGLTDCLRDNMNFRAALVPTGIKNLLLLPAGKRAANPVELLSSQRISLLLEQMRREFPQAYIIFDTSPLLLFAEGRILSTLVDGILFVVRSGLASKLHIAEALSYVEDTNVLGLLCNMATDTIQDRGYGYYNYYYNYHHVQSDAGEPEIKAKPGLLKRLFRR